MVNKSAGVARNSTDDDDSPRTIFNRVTAPGDRRGGTVIKGNYVVTGRSDQGKYMSTGSKGGQSLVVSCLLQVDKVCCRMCAH